MRRYSRITAVFLVFLLMITTVSCGENSRDVVIPGTYETFISGIYAGENDLWIVRTAEKTIKDEYYLYKFAEDEEEFVMELPYSFFKPVFNKDTQKFYYLNQKDLWSLDPYTGATDVVITGINERYEKRILCASEDCIVLIDLDSCTYNAYRISDGTELWKAEMTAYLSAVSGCIKDDVLYFGTEGAMGIYTLSDNEVNKLYAGSNTHAICDAGEYIVCAVGLKPKLSFIALYPDGHCEKLAYWEDTSYHLAETLSMDVFNGKLYASVATADYIYTADLPIEDEAEGSLSAEEMNASIRNEGYVDIYSDNYVTIELNRNGPEKLSLKGEGEYFIQEGIISKGPKESSVYIRSMSIKDANGNPTEWPVYMSTSGLMPDISADFDLYDGTVERMISDEDLPVQISAASPWCVVIPVDIIPFDTEYTFCMEYETNGRIGTVEFRTDLERHFKKAGQYTRMNEVTEANRVCSSDLSPKQAVEYYVKNFAEKVQRDRYSNHPECGEVDQFIVTDYYLSETTADEKALGAYYIFAYNYKNMDAWAPVGGLRYGEGEYADMVTYASGFVLTREDDGYWHVDDDYIDVWLWHGYDVLVTEGYRYYYDTIPVEGLTPVNVIYPEDNKLSEYKNLRLELKDGDLSVYRPDGLSMYNDVWIEVKSIYDFLSLEYDSKGEPVTDALLDISDVPDVKEYTVANTGGPSGYRYYIIEDWNNMVQYDDETGGYLGPVRAYWVAHYNDVEDGGIKCDYILEFK